MSARVVRDVLVDTGFPRVRDEFIAALSGIPIRGVLVTHHHEDHAAAALAARVPMRMHEECEAMLRARPQIGYYRRAIWGRPDRLTAPLRTFDPAPLEVLAMPGHTSDHLVLRILSVAPSRPATSSWA